MAVTFPERFNLADYFLFDRINEGLGNKEAILFGNRSWTYQDVANRTQNLHSELVKSGLCKEQRVLIILPDTPAFCWSIFATLSAGAVVAMGNPDAAIDDLKYVLAYSRASVVITIPRVAKALELQTTEHESLKTLLLVPEVKTGDDPEQEVKITNEWQNLEFKVEQLSKLCQQNNTPLSRKLIKRDDIAFWLFTSGSTGKPKAALHSHRDFAFNTEVYAKNTVNYLPDDITVSIPRLYFGYATGTNLLFPFAVGATTGLFSEHPSPEILTRYIKHYKATVVTNVPTMLGKIMEFEGEMDMSSVRFHLSAGEALPPTLLKRFQERFSQDIYDGIGSAEMFHIYCSNRPGDIKPGSLGKVVEGYEIKILAQDADGPGAPALPAGETGVMWVKGDSVAHGYFQDRDKSWHTFHGHWCRTDDLFRFDEDGYLYFAGRSGDIFKVSGIWIAPNEIEDCLLQHEAVAHCCVIPVDVHGLAKSKALIVLRDDFKADAELKEQLQIHVKERLSRYKYPRIVEFIDALPRNDRGKVDRKSLINDEIANTEKENQE